MITSSILLLLQLGAPTGAAPDDAVAASPPFAGSLSVGLGELRSLALEDRTEEALAIARDLLAREGVGALSASERGEVEYASGVALWHAEREAEATLLFLAAAGASEAPAELRRDALYDAGVMQLGLGERWFGLLPEEGGEPPPVQLGPDGEPLSEEPAPDPLDEARQAYDASKVLLVERLRLDWRDADTRANLELVQRRIARLDEIEEERQEQEEPPPEDSEQEQEQQEEQPDSESGDPSENEESGEQEPSEEEQQESEESEESEQSDEEEQQQESEPSPEESGEQEQEQGDSEEEDAGESGDDGPEEEAPTQEESGEEQEAQPPQQIEVNDLLTDEELIDLLELLETHEEELEVVRRSLRLQRRSPVERDW